MNDNDVIVVGSLNYDILFKQERLPHIGETYTADEVAFACGGKGANQATQCAKLGLNTYMVGKIGNDNFGSILRTNLIKNHVNVDYLGESDTSSTGLGVVNAFNDGSVIATISKGANFDILEQEIELVDPIFKRCSVLILQLEIPIEIVELAAVKAKKHGKIVILNAAPAVPLTDRIRDNVDYLVVNETEAQFYSEISINSIEDAHKAAEVLWEEFHSKIIITLGESGSLYYDGSDYYFEPAKKVKAIETTGAGDSFVGALSYSLINNFSVRETLQFCTAASALTVQGIGAQESMPSLKEIKAFMQNGD